MDHMHDFNHVQIDWLICDLDNVDGINNNIDELVGQVWVKFAAEWGSGDANQKWFLYSLFLNFELLQKSKGFLSCQFVAFSDDSRVNLLNF